MSLSCPQTFVGLSRPDTHKKRATTKSYCPVETEAHGATERAYAGFTSPFDLADQCLIDIWHASSRLPVHMLHRQMAENSTPSEALFRRSHEISGVA